MEEEEKNSMALLVESLGTSLNGIVVGYITENDIYDLSIIRSVISTTHCDTLVSLFYFGAPIPFYLLKNIVEDRATSYLVEKLLETCSAKVWHALHGNCTGHFADPRTPWGIFLKNLIAKEGPLLGQFSLPKTEEDALERRRKSLKRKLC